MKRADIHLRHYLEHRKFCYYCPIEHMWWYQMQVPKIVKEVSK